MLIADTAITNELANSISIAVVKICQTGIANITNTGWVHVVVVVSIFKANNRQFKRKRFC